MTDIKFDVEDEPKPNSTPPKFRGAAPKMAKIGNETLAAQATEVLLQLNGVIAIGAMTFGLSDTASAIVAREEGFKEQVYQALLPDPALCRRILKVQGTGGILSLIAAYLMLGVAVAPVAAEEIRTKRESGELGLKIPAFLKTTKPEEE